MTRGQDRLNNTVVVVPVRVALQHATAVATRRGTRLVARLVISVIRAVIREGGPRPVGEGNKAGTAVEKTTATNRTMEGKGNNSSVVGAGAADADCVG